MDLYSDGSIRMKSQLAGIGGVLQLSRPPRLVMHEFTQLIPYVASINWIEYSAAIHGVTWALQNGFSVVHVHTDSKLVVEQSLGNWVCNQAHLEAKRRELLALFECLDDWSIRHIPREENQHADMLAGVATGREDAVKKYKNHTRRIQHES